MQQVGEACMYRALWQPGAVSHLLCGAVHNAIKMVTHLRTYALMQQTRTTYLGTTHGMHTRATLTTLTQATMHPPFGYQCSHGSHQRASERTLCIKCHPPTTHPPLFSHCYIPLHH
jgi:hypothetical protein